MLLPDSEGGGGGGINSEKPRATLSMGKFDWGSVRNYFSVRTILNSTGCCKLPR